VRGPFNHEQLARNFVLFEFRKDVLAVIQRRKPDGDLYAACGRDLPRTEVPGLPDSTRRTASGP
jgi:hypothetical protein